MRLKGVSYDTGTYMDWNWRPDFGPKSVKRELQVVKEDLHCNAVRITGTDINRMNIATDFALEQGLEVWFSPLLFDKSPTPEATLDYIGKAAAAAEPLRKSWPGKLVFSVGSELTLFMSGILEGKSLRARTTDPNFFANIKAGKHNKPLNEFLAKANSVVRETFHGSVTYCSLVWEAVDWSLFDFVGVDHYRATKIEDTYVEMLKPSFSNGKPVVVTEFGYGTTQDGIGSEGLLSSAGLGGNIIDPLSLALHYKLPVVGRFVHPHLNGNHARDEAWQARKLIETLSVLDGAGVHGAFVSCFMHQINPYSDDPKHDLDVASMSLVKYYEGGRRGATYPDMNWEPKESFRAVADYYANH